MLNLSGAIERARCDAEFCLAVTAGAMDALRTLGRFDRYGYTPHATGRHVNVWGPTYRARRASREWARASWGLRHEETLAAFAARELGLRSPCSILYKTLASAMRDEAIAAGMAAPREVEAGQAWERIGGRW